MNLTSQNDSLEVEKLYSDTAWFSLWLLSRIIVVA